MRCMLPLMASGNPRDVVGGILAEPYHGFSGNGTGHPPALQASAFTFNSLTDPTYKVTAGSTVLRVPGRGWANNNFPRTVWMVVKPWANANTATARSIYVWGSGNDTIPQQLGWTISTAGVITLFFARGIVQDSSSITLTSGKTYLIACTLTSATGRLWQVYSYDDQAYVTTQATGSSTTGSSIASVTSNADAYLNGMSVFDGYTTINPQCEVYACGLTTETMDPATNAYFAALVADPNVTARGTYTSTGTLAPAGICLWDTTTTSITVHSNRPTLGAAGDQNRYQYALHRSTSPWTADPVSSATRVTSLQASPVLVDTTAVANTQYYYCVEQYDGTSTVYSTSATTTNSKQVYAQLSKGDVNLVMLCDSRHRFTTNYLAWALMADGYRVGIVNRSVSSTSMYTATAGSSWQPNTTQDAVNGQASTTLLANALAEASQAGFTKAFIELGANDGSGGNTSSTFNTKAGIFNTYLTGQGFTLWYGYPYPRKDSTLAVEDRIITYWPIIDALDNGTTIRTVGKNNAYVMMREDLNMQATDAIHPVFPATSGDAVARGLIDYVLDPLPTPAAVAASMWSNSDSPNRTLTA